MNDDFFRDRLRILRNAKKISAREMSLALDQNEGYINKIETGQSSVTMPSFFRICEYLNVSPSDFFNENINSTEDSAIKLLNLFRQLRTEEAEHVYAVIQDLCR